MSERSHSIASGFGVVVAMVGTSIQSVAVTWAGPLLALIIHLYGEWHKSKNDALLNHLKLENYQLRVELGKYKSEASQPAMKQSEAAPG